MKLYKTARSYVMHNDKNANITKIIKKFKAHGLICVICVINGSHYTGYVGVPKNHPLYGKDYDYADDFVECHGGLTYSDEKVLDFKPKDTWFFGIDFAHSLDVCKGIYITRPRISNAPIVWTVKKVEKEVRNLAKQLKLENLLAKNL